MHARARAHVHVRARARAHTHTHARTHTCCGISSGSIFTRTRMPDRFGASRWKNSIFSRLRSPYTPSRSMTGHWILKRNAARDQHALLRRPRRPRVYTTRLVMRSDKRGHVEYAKQATACLVLPATLRCVAVRGMTGGTETRQ